MAPFHFESEFQFDAIEQRTSVKDEGYSFLFAHQQKETVYVFEDPFASILQSSMKVDFAEFMDYVYQFQIEFELPVFKFFFLFDENISRKQSNNHLLSSLHWHFSIT
jgi:hypothetical protein